MSAVVMSCLRRFLRGIGWLLVKEYSSARQLARACRRAVRVVRPRRRRKTLPEPEYVI